jgi:hypothetical protein
VRLPNTDARAVSLGKGERVREDKIEPGDGLDCKAGRPVESFGLNAGVDGGTLEALDVALQRLVVVESLASAAVLDDAQGDAARLRDLKRPAAAGFW